MSLFHRLSKHSLRLPVLLALALTCLGGLARAVDDIPTVDVLMLYTQDVEDQEGGPDGVRALVNLMIADTNQAYEDSGINGQVRLAYLIKTDYTPSTEDLDTDLDALDTQGDGLLDEAATLRENWGADLVCLLRKNFAGGSAGLAYVLQNKNGSPSTYTSVVCVKYDASDTFAHEIGHNFGALHDRDNSSFSNKIFTDSYGYRFYGNDSKQYRTIMAYSPGTPIMYFSNPEVSYQGQPTGVLDSENNAKLHNFTMPLVQNYRISTQAFFSLDEKSVTSAAQSYTLDISAQNDWTITSAPSWITLSPDSGNGDSSVTVTLTKNTSPLSRTATLTLDTRTHVITQEGLFDDALLSPDGLTFTRGGDKLPAFQDSVVRAGQPYAVRTGDLEQDETSWLECTVEGPATLTFWAKSAADNLFNFMDVTLNGSKVHRILSYTDWTNKSIDIPAGSHRVKWTYYQNAASDSYPSEAFLDAIEVEYEIDIDSTAQNLSYLAKSYDLNITTTTDWSITGVPSWVTLDKTSGSGDDAVTISIAENTSPLSRTATLSIGTRTHTITQEGQFDSALLSPDGLVFTHGGNKPWAFQNSTVRTGEPYAARAGDLTEGQSSLLECTIEGPATLSFWAKLSTPSVAGNLILTLDNEEAINIEGSTDWDQYTLDIPEGEHTLLWDYTEIATSQASSGEAFLDAIEVEYRVEIDKRSQFVDADAQSYFIEVASVINWAVTGAPAWVTVSPDSGSKGGQVKVTVKKNNATAPRSTTLLFNDVAHKLTQAAKFDDAQLVNNGITFTHGGDSFWFLQSDIVRGGHSYAAQSGAIDAEHDTSWLECKVTGPAQLTFWYKTTGLYLSDSFQLLLDDSLFKSMSPAGTWARVQDTIPEGEHVLRWIHQQREGESDALEPVYLDGIEIAYAVSVSPPSKQLSYEAQSYTFDVITQGSWAITGLQSWATATPDSGTGNTTVTVTVKENEQANQRIMNLKVNTTGHTVVQANSPHSQLVDYYLNLNASYIGNNWYWNYWFGFYYLDQTAWSFHQDYGWVYVGAQGNTESSAWVYIVNQERWFWISNSLEEGVAFDSAQGSFAFWDIGTQQWWPF